MILLSFSSSIKYILSLMLAMLGLLPLENIVEEENNNVIFPAEINYELVDDTLITYDSTIVLVPSTVSLESTYLRVLHSEKMESIKMIDQKISQVIPGETEHIILYHTD